MQKLLSLSLPILLAQSMDSSKAEETTTNKDKKSIITKTWKHCKSLGHSSSKKFSKYDATTTIKLKSKSLSASSSTSFMHTSTTKEKSNLANEGCFSVYVGPDRQRFVVKAKYANHPLFKELLEEAEDEYGCKCDGPITLPCSVSVFCRVLAEMGVDDEIRKGCRGFGRSKSYHVLNQSKMVAMNQF